MRDVRHRRKLVHDGVFTGGKAGTVAHFHGIHSGLKDVQCGLGLSRNGIAAFQPLVAGQPGGGAQYSRVAVAKTPVVGKGGVPVDEGIGNGGDLAGWRNVHGHDDGVRKGNGIGAANAQRIKVVVHNGFWNDHFKQFGSSTNGVHDGTGGGW